MLARSSTATILFAAAAILLSSAPADAGLITPHFALSYFNETQNFTASAPVSWELLSSNNGASQTCAPRRPHPAHSPVSTPQRTEWWAMASSWCGRRACIFSW